MNLLFICSENKLRSPTAEEVFCQYKGINAIGAGTNKDAPTTISGDLIECAYIIFVMEKSHRKKVVSKFNSLLKDKKLVCLDIPDIYDRMEPALVELLKSKLKRYINNR
ncbi:MAG: phosphotyrosine protein phosphatase [Crocosphaera sp.]|uniref:Protein-tyrosine-phosphatase n=2 Tax=Crocosphaera watsonii TaxID=263511 RepID=T2JZF7_CROWT|nr:MULTISPECIES: hypothetical protein [Crocosphaera]MCH2247523.1 phosphotyrosine protein phosphatase [Crocosphaera sp.]CCQ53839.1 hypothetical protein CWATWH0005_5637 [Crocosphaera watsonii WH 0005]CCQ70670.1 hypothetical protein CWATWH0402_6159 [Crocosphaera watsonii WH 0402]